MTKVNVEETENESTVASRGKKLWDSKIWNKGLVRSYYIFVGEINDKSEQCFNDTFTRPIKYLSKKKRIKLEATGKPKLPSAGTSDDWINYHKKKKKKLNKKFMKRKKKLEEEKKVLRDTIRQVQT